MPMFPIPYPGTEPPPETPETPSAPGAPPWWQPRKGRGERVPSPFEPPPGFEMKGWPEAEPGKLPYPNWEDVYRGPLGGNKYWFESMSNLAPNLFVPTFANWGPQALSSGYSSLADMLSFRGQTDPALLNRNITEARSGAQAESEFIGQELARRGLQNFGGGLALQGAALGAGESRVADLMAQESQLSEERRRGDIQLLIDALIDPVMAASGGGQQSYLEGKASKNAMRGAVIGAIGAALAPLTGGASLALAAYAAKKAKKK